jgi:hypothetical protein
MKRKKGRGLGSPGKTHDDQAYRQYARAVDEGNEAMGEVARVDRGTGTCERAAQVLRTSEWHMGQAHAHEHSIGQTPSKGLKEVKERAARVQVEATRRFKARCAIVAKD